MSKTTDFIDTYQSEIMGVAVVVIGLAILYLLGQLIGWILAISLAIGFGMAFGFVPGMIRLLGPSLPLKSTFGLGCAILAQLANGGTCAYVRDNDEIDLVPYDSDKNKAKIDDEWVDVGDDVTEYRIAWRPFVIAWEKSERSIGEYLVDDPDIVVKRDETVLVDEHTNETYLWSTVTDPDDDTYIVHVLRYFRAMGRDGNRLLNRTEEIALRDYAGDRNIGQLTMALLLVGSFFGCFILTYLLMAIL